MIGRSIRIARTAGFVAILALFGCYGDEDETLPGRSDTRSGSHAAQDYWLKPGDHEDPLTFLARVTNSDASRIAPDFERALALYEESPRMIANRAVQLWQEIKQDDEAEIGMPQLLSALAAVGPMEEHSLGAIIQRYRVLRAQGRDHDAAIASTTEAAR